MVEITGVAHFAIPVSDPDRSTRFYTDVVGCKFLSALPDKSMTFLDAGGVCVLLIKRPAPIVRELEYSNGVHHAFMVDATNTKRPWTICGRMGSRSSSRRIVAPA